MKKVSIQDIANDLGLSRNTVSKALSDSETVAYETRLKVQKRALQVGYSKIDPEIKKKFSNLIKSPTKSILVIIDKQIVDFWNRIIIGISDELRKNNYNLMLTCVNDEDEEELRLPSNIEKTVVDGIIVVCLLKKKYIERLVQYNIPMVFLDNLLENSDNELLGDNVVVEGKNSVYEITTRLIKNGCRNIGFIGYTEYCESMRIRWDGFHKAMVKAGIPIDKRLCLNKLVQYNLYIEEEVKRCLDEIQKPDAFVCVNDSIAINVIKYYKAKGYKIPDDISVAGFDDTRNATVVEPALTTVHVCNEQIGARLVQQLVWRINNKDMPFEKIYVSTKPVYRKSTR
ncbi:LacI family DNA-binding transcriptional regulator [Clostridium oryzae]|uniref:Catabolite control protein A n=1 Tax=Clostridium oryzae TaxID=1450648 RepID=A0A1V4IUS8_9CLOT|nr:LacI family DNA-binding transcriptional regulator [Clostridium oryzae]OPJ63534.1 catabolite control protein A [Clostridium oryzae]